MLIIALTMQTACLELESEDRKLMKELIQVLKDRIEIESGYNNSDRQLIQSLIQILGTKNNDKVSLENKDRRLIRELIQILKEKWKKDSSSIDNEDRYLLEDILEVLESKNLKNENNAKQILCNENKKLIQTFIQKENQKKVPDWLKDVDYNIVFSVCAPNNKTIEIDYGQTFVDKEDFITASRNHQAYYSLSKTNIKPGKCELIQGFCGGGGGTISNGRTVIPSRVRLNPDTSKLLGELVLRLQETEEFINIFEKSPEPSAKDKLKKLKSMRKKYAEQLRDAARNNVRIDVLEHFSGT